MAGVQEEHEELFANHATREAKQFADEDWNAEGFGLKQAPTESDVVVEDNGGGPVARLRWADTSDDEDKDVVEELIDEQCVADSVEAAAVLKAENETRWEAVFLSNRAAAAARSAAVAARCAEFRLQNERSEAAIAEAKEVMWLCATDLASAIREEDELRRALRHGKN